MKDSTIWSSLWSICSYIVSPHHASSAALEIQTYMYGNVVVKLGIMVDAWVSRVDYADHDGPALAVGSVDSTY